LSPSPASPRARRAAASPGAFLFYMSSSFNCARSAVLSFLEGIMALILIICKNNVEKTPKTPGIPGVWRRARSSAASSSDRRSGSAPLQRLKQPN
jgi:hypothetical protein